VGAGLAAYRLPSAAERSLIRRASVLTIELEHLEKKFALADEAGAGADPNDLDLYQRAAGNLRRLLEGIGLKRRPREVTTLAEYLEQQQQHTEVAQE
jgi:hypothetical protein